MLNITGADPQIQNAQKALTPPLDSITHTIFTLTLTQ